MALPVNIEQLLNGKIIEWDRLEFKKSWNPEDVLHTICAFANDINNWGGGYIIIGVEENDGIPVLPPIGLQENQIDRIQKELIKITHKIEPFYSPISQPYLYEDKWIFIIWVPGGDNRPYKVPKALGSKEIEGKRYYIRRGSSSAIAKEADEKQLLDLAKKIPFDDRINHEATIKDLDLGLIREFLQEIRSDLFEESIKTPFEEVCRQMRIVNGPDEYLKPLNVGLLFFCTNPQKFFNEARIEVVWRYNESGTSFDEFVFKGPIHKQIREVLSHIRSRLIIERVIKQANKAEAIRVYNYPFEAIEEAVVNAFFHRSYEIREPIIIDIWQNRIEIASLPGPVPPINQQDLQKGRVVARHYRNRRIGDFFKDLDLSEGRCTGIPTIYKKMAANDSPKPHFETDEDRTYFAVTLPINPYFLEVQDNAPEDIRILHYCLEEKSRKEILAFLGLTSHTFNYEQKIVPLLHNGFLQMTVPENPFSKKQKYIITYDGFRHLSSKLLSNTV
ncbi:MAG: RNA-binding domain-containing protein [Spirosomataceae bacterium]